MNRMLALVVLSAALVGPPSCPAAVSGRPRLNSEVISVRYALAEDVAAMLNGGLSPDQGHQTSQAKRLRSLLTAVGIDSTIEVLGERSVVCDRRNNALLVSASPRDLVIIKNIISGLDLALAQVMIDALILEFPAHARQTASVFSGTTGSALSMTRFLSLENTNGAGRLGAGFSYVAQSGSDLDTAAAFLVTNGGLILQHPRIQTWAAVPGTLFVGETRPYPCGSTIGATGLPAVQALDLGLELDLTCLLGPNGSMLMDLHQRISRHAGLLNIAGVGEVPMTMTRNSQAEIEIVSEQTVVLGGFITMVKRPVFSAIPMLDRFPIPHVGSSLNRLITAPKRKIPKELVVLIHARFLPVRETHEWHARFDANARPVITAARAVQN